MSLQAKINSTILKESEWIPAQIGIEINRNGSNNDRMFNESEELIITEGPQYEFQKSKNQADWFEIEDVLEDTNLRGGDLYEYLMLLSKEDMLFDKKIYRNHRGDEKPDKGEVTPEDIEDKFSYLLDFA